VATTSGIAESQGLDLILDEGLRERSFGIFEGLLRSEAEELNAEAFRRWTSGSFTEAVPGGESRKDLCERILEVLKMLAKTHQGQSIAVTTHGGVLASLWRYLEPKREESRGFSIPNGSISHIKVSSAGDWEVVQWSSVDHL
jgi:probable phosphoglycerate mutase